MVSGALKFDATLVRCAAQMLSGEGISMETLARLAIQERAVPVIRHIAQSALELDAEETPKWQKLLSLLPPDRQLLVEGRLPHRSRFAIQTGRRWVNGRLERGISTIWLRPNRRRQP